MSTNESSLPQQALIGAQMLFVAFGALVLVPILTGLNPNVALFTAGIGTLIFQFVTRRQVPIFLASSFAASNSPLSERICQRTWPTGSSMSGLAEPRSRQLAPQTSSEHLHAVRWVTA